jgi:alpha-mannosidase
MRYKQREAYLLNYPIIVYRQTIDYGQKTMVNRLSSMVSVSASNVIIETIKYAEDGSGITVHLYESQRKRGQVKMQMGFAVASAWETNLLEENDAIQLNLRLHQIMAVRLKENG